MIGRNEIRRSLEGAWLLFLNRAEAMRHFDLTIAGFWRSFQAIFLIAPIYALTAIVDARHLLSDAVADVGFSEPAYVFEKALALGLDWIAFPILLALAAPSLGVDRTYSAYIVARNWAAVLAAVPFGAIALLTILGIFNDSMAAILSLAAIAVVLRYNFIVARTALGVGIGLAAAIVISDLLVSLMIASGIDSLFGASGGAQ
jgi:hypothetical protein